MGKLIGIIIVVALLFVVVLGVSGYNGLVKKSEAVNTAWSQVENVYQRRADLIPNLVETVKGAANFEQETLTKVVEARASASQVKLTPEMLSDPQAMQRFEAAQGQLSGALSRLLVTVERYPDLKANQNFRDLQAQLEGTENRITVARKRYIETVAEYNKLVRFFPTNLTARFLLGAEVRPTFEAREGTDKPPEVKF